MRLIELRISNFRGLGGNKNVINFDNSNVIFLLGQNNVGKSSFLHAYEFFVSSKQKAQLSDFFQNDIANPIEIEADFLYEENDDNDPELTKDPEWISRWVQNTTGFITIKKVWSESDQASKKYTKDPNGKYVLNGFGGMETLFTKYSPTPIIINAIETIESLEKSVNDIIDKEHLKKIETEYKTEYDTAVASILAIQDKVTTSDIIKTYNENINTSFKKVFPSLSLKISIKDEGQGIDIIKAFKTNHSIDVQKDGVDRKETFAQHGNGVIRQALFNFLAFLKNDTPTEKKEFLLLFEEPELFLHPKSTRLLREELYSLAENSPFQILCCTHCPQMVDISKPHCSLVRVCKMSDESTYTYQVGHSIFQNEANKDFVQMVNRFDPNVCEVFYSNIVVLVEGDTEAVICRELLDTKYHTEDIYVLNTGSKNNMPFFQRILNHFNIPYVLIHDSDTRYVYENKERKLVKFNNDNNPRSNSAWSLNASIWEEIENGRNNGNKAYRIISEYDFESQNGYEVNTEFGKPLSAYKFAVENRQNDSLPIKKQLDEIVSGKFTRDWTQDDIEAIKEPFENK